MNIENHVCSFDQSIMLAELGVHQKSIWYWEKMREPVMEGCATKRVQLYANVGHPIPKGVVESVYSAFTVSELGLMMPEEFVHYFDFPGYVIPESKEYLIRFKTWFYNEDGKRIFGCRYDYNGNINIASKSFLGSEAEARAGLLIYLLANDWVSVDDINALQPSTK